MTPNVIQRWFQYMDSGDGSILDGLLADDVTFYSPAVFTPQRGRAVATPYLVAARTLFTGTDFSYTASWYADRSAVLEFTVDLDGVKIEGIDMVHWSDEDRIRTFKVMVRPLKGLQTLIPKMGELLSSQAVSGQKLT